MAGVVLKDVCKVYDGGGTFLAVNHVNLAIKDREFMVLVGPSGCGKSTTLRMIAGLEEISSGTISIGDRVVNNVPPKDRDIAMVFQNYALYPHKTVYENMAFGLRLRKFPKADIDKRVRAAAEILGIESFLNRKPKALSGGQRQRVAVGRAIVRKPEVFLFDEPLSNLDAKMRVQMRTEISKLHTRLETTMIYVTHDQIEAMTMGDRICVMKDGLIQQVDTPLNIYDHPANTFVAGFIGTPPMNIFRGKRIKPCTAGFAEQCRDVLHFHFRSIFIYKCEQIQSHSAQTALVFVHQSPGLIGKLPVVLIHSQAQKIDAAVQSGNDVLNVMRQLQPRFPPHRKTVLHIHLNHAVVLHRHPCNISDH